MNENEKVYSSEEKEMPQEINSGNEIKDMSSDEAVNDIEETVVADLHSAAGQDERNVRTMSKEELLDRLRKIVEEENVTSSKVVTALKQRFYFLRNAEIEAEMKAYMAAGNPVDAFAAMPDPLEVEFKDLLNTFKEKRSEYLASEEEKKVENLQFKQRILDQMKSLAEDIDNVNLHFPKFKQLQQDFKNIDNIPETAVTEVWKTFQEVVELFYDRFKMNKELRDLDFKKNLEIKTALIEEARKLEEMEDVVDAEHRLQELHVTWRETGPVAKEVREDLWEQFRAASTIVNKRHQAYFEERKAQAKKNEDLKISLCEKIEAIDVDGIKTFAEWETKTKEILDLQSQWKEIGFASRKSNNVLFGRFRKACDDFFSCKSEAYKKTKEELNLNLARKTELCERAEAIKESGDIKEGVKKILELQEEWKKIGAVPRKYNDSIWNRFRAACNYFFDERRKQTASVRKSEQENLSVKKALLDELRNLNLDVDKAEAVRVVKSIQAKWQSAGFVPFKDKDIIQKEYRALLDEIYAKLDVKFTRDRISKFEERMSSSDSQPDRERDKLFRALEGRKNELKTYENNLCFFNVKSKEGSQMLKDMERKMQRLRSEIEEIKEKIRLIDSKQ